MSYRVLCDENVEPATVGELEAEGKTASHVNARPGRSSDDGEVARSARENGYAVLTNDADFLGCSEPNLTVLYFPDNDATAHDLASRIVELQRYYPNQSSLPKEYFLSARRG